ncbi:MAG: ABC transporter permease [Anaerolineales bacterium]|nr:ABC transporter permease [Anaerolineales bacterium]
MSKRNYPLIIGSLLTIAFVIIAIIGPMLAPIDPMERFSDVIRDSEGNMYIPSVRPLPPFTLNMFPLGTDNAGRDIFSRLLWAVRPTLVACTAVVIGRLLIAVPLGLLVGWFQESWFDRLTNGLTSIIVAIPQLILAIAIIALSEERELSLFIAVLTLIGWPDMMQYIRNQTRITSKAEFIESAQSIGATTPAILRRHIFPQLWPALPSLIAFELSAVLLLFAELGFLGFFIGNGYVIFGADPNSAGVIATGLTSGTPELGQMLSDFWAKIFESPWEMVSAATVIFLMVFGFNLLGEGLRRQMDITR